MKKVDTSLIVYPLLMAMVMVGFYLFPLPGYSAYLYPLELLMVGFFASAIVTKSGHEEFSTFFKGLGVVFALYTLPLSFGHNETLAMSVFVLGLSIASLASKLSPGLDLIVRGIGVSLAVLSPYLLVKVPVVKWPFLYLSLIIALVYILAAVEKVMGGSGFLEENIMGVIAISVLLIGYGFLKHYFRTTLGRYYIYIEWAVVLASLVIVSSMITSYFSRQDFSEYLVGAWKRHEAELGLVEDEELKNARAAVQAFVVEGDASALVAFLTSYLKTMPREKLEGLLRPLVTYCPKPLGIWTPPWLVKKMKESELERRVKLVKELLSTLKEVERL